MGGNRNNRQGNVPGVGPWRFGRLSFVLVVLVVTLFSDPAEAQDTAPRPPDRVELDNGDRLAGSILPTVSEDFLEFRHPVLGLLRIPFGRVREVRRSGEVVPLASFSLAGETPASNELPVAPALATSAAARAGDATADKAADTAAATIPTRETVASAAAVASRPAKAAAQVDAGLRRDWRLLFAMVPLLDFATTPQPLAEWKHRVSFGLRIQSGKHDSQQLTGRVESNRNLGDNSNFRSSVLREYAYYRDVNGNKVMTRDLTRVEFRVRRQWSEDWFIQSTNRYRREPTRRVEHEITATAGVGYQLFKTERWSANVVPSVTGNYLETEVPSSGDGERVLASLFQDLAFRFNERWSAAQTFEYNHDFDPDVGGFANFTFRVETRLLRALSLNNRFELTYDARSNGTLDPYERRFFTELVYEF